MRWIVELNSLSLKWKKQISAWERKVDQVNLS